MKKLLFAIIILAFNTNYSQIIKESNWIVKLNALQLIDFGSFPTAQISAERKLTPCVSINMEFGYQFYGNGAAVDTIIFKPKGFKANIEGRVYFQKLFNSRINSRRTEFFVGIQFFYRQNQKSNFIRYNQTSVVDGDSITKLYRDSFGVKKTNKGINLTFGNQISIKKRLILEPFIAVGYMCKKIDNTELRYNENKHSTNIDDGIGPFVGADLADHSRNVFNFGFGFRVGYRI